MDLDIPPSQPGLIPVRFFDRGGDGDHFDVSAFWAYCQAVPRAGEHVTTPDGNKRTVHRVWHSPMQIRLAPAGQRGPVSDYWVMQVWAELVPRDERIPVLTDDPRPE